MLRVLQRVTAHRRIARSIEVVVHADGDIVTRPVPVFIGREYSSLEEMILPKSLWAYIFLGDRMLDVAALADIWTISENRFSVEVARMDAAEQTVTIGITDETHTFPHIGGTPPQEGIGYFYTEVSL